MPTEKEKPKARNPQNCQLNGWAKMRFIPLIECMYTGECGNKMPLGRKGTFCKQSPLESCGTGHAPAARHKSVVGKIFGRRPL